MFKTFFRRRKIKTYARELPLALTYLYGETEHYSKVQVDEALKRQNLYNTNNTAISAYCFAYAMYCSSAEFQQIHEAENEDCSYDNMRQEICDTLFYGVTELAFSTLLLNAAPLTTHTYSSSSGCAGSDGCDLSGGFDGGGSGGGDGGGS